MLDESKKRKERHENAARWIIRIRALDANSTLYIFTVKALMFTWKT